MTHIALLPFQLGLTNQEYRVLLNELNTDKHLYQYKDKFIITEMYTEPNFDCVMISGFVDSAETAFKIGKWVATVHDMNKAAFGDNYKINPNWNQKSN